MNGGRPILYVSEGVDRGFVPDKEYAARDAA